MGTADAQLTPSTAWTLSTPYPGGVYVDVCSSGSGGLTCSNQYEGGVAFEGCGTNAGYIFCTGGTVEFLNAPFYNDGTATFKLDYSYYAPISSGGVGTWQQTTN